MVCPPVRGENERALTSRLSPIQLDKPWYNYFVPFLISVPVGIWCQNDVVFTSMRRYRIDVNTTSFWHQMPTRVDLAYYDFKTFELAFAISCKVV